MSKLHLDYTEYKNLIGDNGVTDWTKYNWFSGPEDETFGGYKKVWVKDLNWGQSGIYFFVYIDDLKPRISLDIAINAYSNTFKPVPNSSESFKWEDEYFGYRKTVTSSGNLSVQQSQISTVAEFKERYKDTYIIYPVKPQQV